MIININYISHCQDTQNDQHLRGEQDRTIYLERWITQCNKHELLVYCHQVNQDDGKLNDICLQDMYHSFKENVRDRSIGARNICNI